MENVGLIQPRGIGDIVISLPIAKYYADQGYAVHMPIFKPFIESFSSAVLQWTGGRGTVTVTNTNIILFDSWQKKKSIELEHQ